MPEILSIIANELPNAWPVGDKDGFAFGIRISSVVPSAEERRRMEEEEREERETCAATNDSSMIQAVHARMDLHTRSNAG